MKNPNWTKQTNRERKAARAARSTQYVTNPQESRFSRRFARYGARIQASTGAQLVSWYNRTRKARNGQAHSFVKWMKETQGRIPGNEFPDLKRAAEFAVAENLLEIELSRRKIASKFNVSTAVLTARTFYPEYP